jgi:hypothetical protein
LTKSVGSCDRKSFNQTLLCQLGIGLNWMNDWFTGTRQHLSEREWNLDEPWSPFPESLLNNNIFRHPLLTYFVLLLMIFHLKWRVSIFALYYFYWSPS